MPYLISCNKCSWTFACKKQGIEDMIEGHDTESHHNHNEKGWRIAPLTQAEYDSITVAMQDPSFWKALRFKPLSMPLSQ